jgi:hypothetical protein
VAALTIRNGGRIREKGTGFSPAEILIEDPLILLGFDGCQSMTLFPLPGGLKAEFDGRSYCPKWVNEEIKSCIVPIYRELLIYLPFGSAARRAKGGRSCGHHGLS